MKTFVQLILILNLCFGIVSSQYFGSGFYQGGFRATGFSPFGYQNNPYLGGVGYPGVGGGNTQTHVHYHVPVNNGFGGDFGGGFGGLGVNSRDLGAGAVGFILGSLLNKNKK